MRHAQRFAGVEFAEVDGLGDIGVGFAPVLADLEDEPGAELEAALANYVGDVEDETGALFGRTAAPGRGKQRGRPAWRLDFRKVPAF